MRDGKRQRPLRMDSNMSSMLNLIKMRGMVDMVNGGGLVPGGSSDFGLSVPSSRENQKTLWIGDLAPWMDEEFLYSIFGLTNQLLSVKVIRNKSTGASEGYAFLEMLSHEAATCILNTYNGKVIPGSKSMVFRLNWAAYGVGRSAQPNNEDHSLFVGDLAPDVSDLILQEYFRQFYPSVRNAKVITDASTGRSKGYGFVRFSVELERNMALSDMNGQILSNRPIRVSLATAKRSNQMIQNLQNLQMIHPSDVDPTNTTLFIGGLSSQVVEDQLRILFGQFGDIIYVKIPQGKGCGFVQYVLRSSAEHAMLAMNGKVLGNSAMRISWGRSSGRSSSQNIDLPSFSMPGQESRMVHETMNGGSFPSMYSTPLPSSDLLTRSSMMQPNIDVYEAFGQGIIAGKPSFAASQDLDGSNQSGSGFNSDSAIESPPLSKVSPVDVMRNDTDASNDKLSMYADLVV